MSTQGGGANQDWFDMQYSTVRNATTPRPPTQHHQATWQSQLGQESFGQPPAQEANAPMRETDVPMDSPRPTDHENLNNRVRFSIALSCVSESRYIDQDNNIRPLPDTEVIHVYVYHSSFEFNIHIGRCQSPGAFDSSGHD